MAAGGPPVRAWLHRTAALHRELAAIADVDAWWWLVAAGVAFAETRAHRDAYLACDPEPDADTLMAYRALPPRDLVDDAISRAHAARTAVRELDGMLPDQPLAVTIRRAEVARSQLDVAAFAFQHHCLIARLDDPMLAAQLAGLLAGETPPRWSGAPPFVCVSIGREPIETARHGHRRAWTEQGGPWLGLGRADDVAVVSTCHLIVDGYGHARITARIAELTRGERGGGARLPSIAPIADAAPLAVVWRELATPTPRVIPLAYQLGQILHRNVGDRDARFSPTIQIPVARGRKDDPMRLHRRVVAAATSVRFDRGVAEPFVAFEARVRDVIAREAAAAGLVSRLLAAARAAPLPLSWKRKSISARRPAWLERFADVIGGRALLSRIAIDVPAPPICAVSCPSRLASSTDPIGGCVITIVEGGGHGAITMCGSGLAATGALLDELGEWGRAQGTADKVATRGGLAFSGAG